MAGPWLFFTDYSALSTGHTNARFSPQTHAHDSLIHIAQQGMPCQTVVAKRVSSSAPATTCLSCFATTPSPSRLRIVCPSSDTPSRPCACLLAAADAGHALPLALHLLAHLLHPVMLCMQHTSTNIYWSRLVANRVCASTESRRSTPGTQRPYPSSSRRFPQTLGCHQSLLLFCHQHVSLLI